jgi:cell division protein FtsW
MTTLTTLLILAVGSLVALSLTVLSSATLLDRDPGASLGSQVISCGIGLVAMVMGAGLDYRRWGRKWCVWGLYGVTLVLLALVLVFAPEVKGARRWLWKIQPAELAKLTMVLVLAWYGSRYWSEMAGFWVGVGRSALVVTPMIGLVLLEPDRGTAALMMAVTLAMMLLAGVRWLHVGVPALVGGVVLTVMIVVNPMARNRIERWVEGDGYQVNKGLMALGQGGVTGTGLGRGTLKYNVPEVHTDFILPAVGEELGLTFTLGVVGAYVLILICGFTIASKAPDRFGMLLAAGITSVISTQAIVNIGVVTEMLPNKGMPLPFVSRGGSNLMVLLAMVGLLVSVARQASGPSVPVNPGRSRGRRGRSPFSNETELPETA